MRSDVPRLAIQRERAAFEAADRVPASDWDGDYVWDELFQDIFPTVEELLERYREHGADPPEYVWECEEHRLRLSAEDIIGAALERQEAWDGARDTISEADEEILQALLDGWLADRRVAWWKPGRRRAVVLTRAEEK